MIKRHKSPKHNFILLPILIVLCLLPLVVYTKPIIYDTSMLRYYPSDTLSNADIFTYYKSLVLIISSVLMVSIVVKQHYVNRCKYHHKIFIPAYAYTVLVLLSTVLSISTYYSLKGYINHVENTYVLLSYMIVFIFTAENIKTTKHLDFIIRAWMISIGVLTVIGLTQILGFDFYRSELGLDLIVPSKLRDNISNVDYTLWGDNLIYQSLFHYNYVSFYSATALPFFLALLIDSSDKKQKLLYTLIVVATLLNLIGSQGRNGFIGVVFGAFIVLVFYSHRLLTNKYILLAGLAAVLCIVVFALVTDTTLEKRFTAVFTDMNDQVDYSLNNITTVDDDIRIDHDDFQLVITGNMNDGALSYAYTTVDGQSVDAAVDNRNITLTPPDGSTHQYDSLKMTLTSYKDVAALSLNIDGVDWHFIYQDIGFTYLNPYGETELLTPAVAYGFDGKERWGSKRGYIWSRTFPMLALEPIFGYGPDTYAIAFPQNDYVGKFNAYGNTNTVVDKPHNILLNYASNTGIPSMIAILTIVIIGFWHTLKNFMLGATVKPELKVYAVASIGAVTGYLTAGMFNDTSLHVTPVFWVIMGINYAVNFMASAD